MMCAVLFCLLRICGVGECSFYEPDDELFLCQPIFAQMLLDPYEEFLRYLQRQRPCPVAIVLPPSKCSLMIFSTYSLSVSASSSCSSRTLMCSDSGIMAQRFFLLFVHELYSFPLSQAKYTRSSSTKLFIISNEDHRQNKADATSYAPFSAAATPCII